MARTTKKREPKVKQPPLEEIGVVKSDIDWVSVLGIDNQNPDKQVKRFGLDYFDDIEIKDGHYRHCIRTRKSALLSRQYDILPASEDPRDVEIAEFVKWNLENIEGTFKQDLREILDAIAMGYSVSEIIYYKISEGKYAGKWGLKALRHKPAKVFIFKTDDKGRLKEDGFCICIPGTLEERPVPKEKFVHFVFDSKYENPYGRGLGSTCAWYTWFKKNGAKFWLIFLEKFGSPTPKATIPKGATKADIERIDAILRTFQQQTGIRVPEGFEITLLEATRRGDAGYQYLLDWCDRQMSKAILGQTLTSDVGERGTGSYALGKVHAHVKEEIVQADAEEVQEVINEQVIRRLVDYNYVVSEYPKFVFIFPKETGKVDSNTLKLLLQAGLPVGVNWAYEYYGIPRPGEGEQTLNAPAPKLPLLTGEPAQEAKFAEFDITSFTEDVGRDLDKYVEVAIAEVNPLLRRAIDDWLARIEASGAFEGQPMDRIVDVTPDFSAVADVLSRLTYLGALKGITDAQRILKAKGWQPNKPAQYSEPVVYFRTLVGTEIPKPEEALAWFQRLQPVTRDVFDKDKLAGKATTVAWTESQSAVKIAQSKLFEALENGWTFEQFRDSLLADPGFTSKYRPPVGVNRNAHLETVFRTNLMSAYNQGRLQMYNDPELGNFVTGYRYNAILDERVRPAHAAMDGRVYPKSSPIWQTWMPPNGFNCRCTIDPVTELETVQWDPQPDPSLMPDPGFGGGRVSRRKGGPSAGPARLRELEGRIRQELSIDARLSGMEADDAQLIYDTLKELVSQYPDCRLSSLKCCELPLGDAGRTMGSLKLPFDVHIHLDPSKFDEAEIGEVWLDGWWAFSSRRGLLYHEWAHNVQYHRWNETVKGGRKRQKRAKELFKSWLEQGKVDDYVSGYAKWNELEFFAELFAMHKEGVTAGLPRSIAREVVQMLKEVALIP